MFTIDITYWNLLECLQSVVRECCACELWTSCIPHTVTAKEPERHRAWRPVRQISKLVSFRRFEYHGELPNYKGWQYSLKPLNTNLSTYKESRGTLAEALLTFEAWKRSGKATEYCGSYLPNNLHCPFAASTRAANLTLSFTISRFLDAASKGMLEHESDWISRFFRRFLWMECHQINGHRKKKLTVGDAPQRRRRWEA